MGVSSAYLPVVAVCPWLGSDVCTYWYHLYTAFSTEWITSFDRASGVSSLKRMICLFCRALIVWIETMSG